MIFQLILIEINWITFKSQREQFGRLSPERWPLPSKQHATNSMTCVGLVRAPQFYILAKIVIEFFSRFRANNQQVIRTHFFVFQCLFFWNSYFTMIDFMDSTSELSEGMLHDGNKKQKLAFYRRLKFCSFQVTSTFVCVSHFEKNLCFCVPIERLVNVSLARLLFSKGLLFILQFTYRI